MKPLPIVMALAAGGCVAGVFYAANSVPPQEQAARDETAVVLAKEDIPATTELNPDLFVYKRMAKELVPDGAFTEEAMKEILRSGKKLYAKNAIEKRTVLTEKRFSGTAGVRGLLAPRMRAFSIPIHDAANAVGNFISPGDAVDVLLTMTTGDGSDAFGGAVTRTLMQKVKLLAVGDAFTASGVNEGGKPDRIRHVTVELKPDQVADLQLAANQGTLSLTLRPEGDAEDVVGNRSTRRKLVTGFDNPEAGGRVSGFEAEQSVHERIDRLDKEWQAKFDALSKAPRPAAVPQGGPSYLTNQMFRGQNPSSVKVKTPSKKKESG